MKRTPLERIVATLWRVTADAHRETRRQSGQLAEVADRCLTAELKLLANEYASTVSSASR